MSVDEWGWYLTCLTSFSDVEPWSESSGLSLFLTFPHNWQGVFILKPLPYLRSWRQIWRRGTSLRRREKMKNGDKKRQYRISRRARDGRQNPNFPPYCSQLSSQKQVGDRWRSVNQGAVESIPCGISRLQKWKVTDPLLLKRPRSSTTSFKRFSLSILQATEWGRPALQSGEEHPK